MKLKIVGPAVALLLLVGGVGVSATSNSNEGIPNQLEELQTTVSNLVNEVKDLLPLKDDVKSAKDELTTANSTIAEMQSEINSMKKEIADLKSASSSSEETLTPEVKQAFLKELEAHKQYLGYYEYLTTPPYNKFVPYNITKVDFTERNGKIYVQTFVEGTYDWGSKYYTYGTPSMGNGLQLAQSIVSIFNTIAPLYDVSALHFEFFQNGQKINYVDYAPTLINN